jgi:hypothetical protein
MDYPRCKTCHWLDSFKVLDEESYYYCGLQGDRKALGTIDSDLLPFGIEGYDLHELRVDLDFGCVCHSEITPIEELTLSEAELQKELERIERNRIESELDPIPLTLGADLFRPDSKYIQRVRTGRALEIEEDPREDSV